MNKPYHRLLTRQIKKHLDAEKIPEGMENFLNAISQCYKDADEDLRMLERSMTISSTELAEMNANLNAVFQAIPDVFLRIDLNGTILECKTGRSDEPYYKDARAFLKKRIQDVPDHEARTRIAKALEDIRRDRKITQIEYALDIQGEKRIYEARFAPLNESQYVVIIREITENKKWEEELKQAQTQILQSEKLASIGQLAAGVAHEINNPIGFVSSNMQTLEEYTVVYLKVLRLMRSMKSALDRHDMKKAEELIRDISSVAKDNNLEFMMDDVGPLLKESREGLDRVRKIVLDLRTFAREDKGQMEQVRVEDIIESILRIVQNEIRYKAELKMDYGVTSMIKCNPQKISQVFMNLIVNASQAIEDKGKVGIKTYQKNGEVCVEISDNGKGIPEDKLGRIFEPFFTTKPVGEGTGLGLSLSYDIVKKHGGDIMVKSDPGRGTTFTVVLPVTRRNTSG